MDADKILTYLLFSHSMQSCPAARMLRSHPADGRMLSDGPVHPRSRPVDGFVLPDSLVRARCRSADGRVLSRCPVHARPRPADGRVLSCDPFRVHPLITVDCLALSRSLPVRSELHYVIVKP